MENMLNQDLMAAVKYLRDHRVIKRDKDIADLTGYAKASISNYTNGKLMASHKFIEKFEEVYKLKVSDFKVGGEKEEVHVADSFQLMAESFVKLLAGTRVNQSLLIEILANQSGKTNMELSLIVNDTMEQELKQIVNELKLADKI